MVYKVRKVAEEVEALGIDWFGYCDGSARFTEDLDIMYRRSSDNLEHLKNWPPARPVALHSSDTPWAKPHAPRDKSITHA